MVKIKITGRQKVFRMDAEQINNDKGLWALNGYQEHVFTCVNDENWDKLVDRFEALYPTFKGCDCEIRVIE